MSALSKVRLFMNTANIKIVHEKEDFKSLANIINSLTEHNFISIDTEFIRNKTYYPKLYILQLCIKGEVYIVDTTSKVDYKPFYEALVNTKATALVFSGREDFEILRFECKKVCLDVFLPENCVDLQLLLAFLNISYSQGLQAAIKEQLDIELIKDQTLSDWSLRPLSDEQLDYAANDVLYLEQLYKKLLDRAEKNDPRLTYFKMEMKRFIKSIDVDLIPETAYVNIAGAGALNVKQLNILKHLCMKRAEIALTKDEALNRIITTKALCKIAQCRKLNHKNLIDYGMKFGAIRAYGDDVIRWFSEAIKLSVDTGIKMPFDYFSCNKAYSGKFKELRHHLKKVACDIKICPEIICNKNLCNDYFYALSEKRAPIILSSWYKDVVGEIDLDKVK